MTKELLGAALNYLKEQAVVEVVFYKGSAININLPTHVELEVTETPPAFRGDTAQGGNKPATLETGLRINVPMFITPGDRGPGGHSHRGIYRTGQLSPWPFTP